MKFTVLGASGYVGSNLRVYLESLGHEVFCPSRGSEAVFSEPLGYVIYCIGLTADFRTRPVDTVEAHITYLGNVLARAQYDSLLYLSTTRVYLGTAHGNEDGLLQVNPSIPDDLYNLSKLTGEALCRAFQHRNTRVARLSNVNGGTGTPPTFLEMLKTSAQKGHIHLQSGLRSAKDYVLIDDVVRLLPLIAVEGRSFIYNVASGINTEAAEIIEHLRKLYIFDITVAPDACDVVFPLIQIGRVVSEFGIRPSSGLSF